MQRTVRKNKSATPAPSSWEKKLPSTFRYASLSLAKMGCLQRSPTCTGVVEDDGLVCYGKLRKFELRKSIVLDENLDGGDGKAKFGTAHLRVDCNAMIPWRIAPPPNTPRPSWPSSWECYDVHPNINLPAPLHEERCSVRFSTLEDAKLACAQRIPECTGIVDDSGIVCDGTASRQFELRSSLMMEAAPGVQTWLRTDCALLHAPPPPLYAPPPYAPIGVFVPSAVAVLAIGCCIARRRLASPLREQGMRSITDGSRDVVDGLKNRMQGFRRTEDRLL